MEVDDDVAQDKLVVHADKLGWRLEVWESGFWMGSFDWRIRPLPQQNDREPLPAEFGVQGYRSVEDAKAAAIKTFQERMRTGQIKPRTRDES